MSASIDGVPVTKARVQIPAWGRAWADVDLAEPVDFVNGSHKTLEIGGVSVAVTIASGAAAHGRAGYHAVAGKGGWGKPLSPKSYLDDAGTRSALILSDAAAECGETITGLPTTRGGSHFARSDGPASDVLHALAFRNWYVGLDGVTRIGRWPVTTYAGDAPRTKVDTISNTIELATESVVGLVPGVVVDGMAPALDVEYLLESSRLTVRVWGGASFTSRRIEAMRKIFDALDPRRKYRGSYEFRVVTRSGERVNLQPIRASSGFGDLAKVPIRPGLAGTRADVKLGSAVVVSFLDADPSRPFVYAHDHADSPGWMPDAIELGGPGALGVARITDTVQAGPFAGAITGCSATVRARL